MHPTFGTLKGHTLPVLLVVRVYHGHAICIPVIHLPTGSTVRQTIFWKCSGPFNLNWAGLIRAVAPLCDIHVVDAPVTADAAKAII